MLTIELLGPLRVRSDAGPIELPAGRLRAILAVLAMSSGRPVATDRLATAVWGADPVGDPSGNVRTNIKRLRRVLGAAEAELIVARPGSYLLAVEPERVDALRFGLLLDQAAAAGDPAAERSLLGAALDLWGGTPFDGVGSDWLDRYAAPGLRDRYLSALERRVDLDLADGSRPDPAELSDLVERHPLRESLWARLLRSLASAGRPAEALQRYETVRRRLSDELGTDPGPELRQVHAELLADDPFSQVRAVPRQLPAAVDAFTGRETEIAILDKLLRPPGESRPRSPVIAVVTGTAGVGKTALALHWAHRVADRFPDGQIHLDLRGYEPAGQPVRPAAAIREVLAALWVPPHQMPDGPAAQAGLARSLLAGRRVLLLIDNAREAEQVVPLLPGSPGCLVIVTGRDQLTGLVVGHGAHPVPLGLLVPDEARRLLARRLGHDRLAAEPLAAKAIVERCAGLPLALAVVAAQAVMRPSSPLRTLVDELEDALGALDRSVDVRALFTWSYRTLGDAAKRLFRLAAGLHPGPACTVEAAAALAGLPVGRVRGPLAELVRANLLTEQATGRYTCHDLLRAYAAERCEAEDGDQGAALHRLAEHCLHTVYGAARVLHGYGDDVPERPRPDVPVIDFGEPEEAKSWFAAERPALVGLMDRAAELGLDRHVCLLARPLAVLLHRSGHWHERAAVQRAAIEAAPRQGDAQAARAHCDLASALADLGRFEEAHGHLDAAVERSTGDLRGRAWAHYQRNLVYATQSRAADALDAARSAHELFAASDDPIGQAMALTDIGWHHGRLGDHGRALESCREALAEHRRLGNRPYEAHSWSCLADIHILRGDTDAAVGCHDKAIDLFRALGDLYGEAGALAHRGACRHGTGDERGALDDWRRAHALLDGRDAFTVEQIHTQLAAFDRAAADAFLRHL